MTRTNDTNVRERQDPLRKKYKSQPDAALITDRAKTSGGAEDDPFNGWVFPGEPEHALGIRFGIHRAVGGHHDAPNPGDLLCAALAACIDSTIRIIANRLKVKIHFLEVEVTAKADVRGTLMVDRQVPVGFQEMDCDIQIRAAEGTDPTALQTLISSAEHCCVNLQTLLAGLKVSTKVRHS